MTVNAAKTFASIISDLPILFVVIWIKMELKAFFRKFHSHPERRRAEETETTLHETISPVTIRTMFPVLE